MIPALRRILDFLIPTRCCYCHSSVGRSQIPHFCPDCWADFSIVNTPVCPRCGKPFESPESMVHSSGHLCLACRKQLPQFDQALAVGQFEGALREAVHQFKYRPCRALGKPLGEWMADRVRLPADFNMIIPVPLHPTRLRKRGFNQSLLLAHRISLRNDAELCYDNLARTRPTQPQVELRGDERIRNVADAFTLRNPGRVRGKNIFLIDDVFTTGATMNECASVLKQAGAERVAALALARAV